MFIASSGNQGDGPVQWSNFPGSYPEVINVGSVDCANTHSSFSQSGPTVELVAPGESILMAVPERQGDSRAWVGTMPAPRGVAPAEAAYGTSVGGSAEPLPVTGAPLRQVFNATVEVCSVDTRAAASCGNVTRAVCLVQVVPLDQQSLQACRGYTACLQGGASAVAFYSPPEEGWPDAIFALDLNCGPGCQCWKQLNATLAKSTSRPMPAVSLSAAQGAVLAKAASSKQRVTVATYPFSYEYADGTSSAAAFVSGGAARLWAAFPDCPAQVIRAALTATARRLGKERRDNEFGFGLVQLEGAFKWLQKQPCAGQKKP